MTALKIEGYSVEELELLIGTEEFEALIFTDKPVVFNAGSAEILGQFHVEAEELHIDLAHIDGGGEGVLISINSLAKKYALNKGFAIINWYVHATNCAKPNLKLQRILKLKSFEVQNIEGKGPVHYKRETLEK